MNFPRLLLLLPALALCVTALRAEFRAAAVISIRIRNESPFRHTFYFGYTNGWLGYLPTAQAFREGGYEPRTSPFTEQAEKDFGEGVLSFLAGLPRN